MKAKRMGAALLLWIMLAQLMLAGLSPRLQAFSGEELLSFQSVTCNRDATSIDFKQEDISDWQGLYSFLDQLPELEQVDMYASSLSLEQMEALSQRYPDVFFGWTLTLGEHRIRTDATAFSTLHHKNSPHHSSQDMAVLKYCKHLLALDLGHNSVDDLSFLYDLPHLRILILGKNLITDASPIGALHHLEYLELFSNQVSEIQWVANCQMLLDLNLTNNTINDLSPALSLPNLERLWLCGSRDAKLFDTFSGKEKKEIKSQVKKGCVVNFNSAGAEDVWRKHLRYWTIRRIFKAGVYEPW